MSAPDILFPSSGRPEGRLLGWLPDGTPRYAPLGRMLADGDRVCCHLCGRWFLSVASHLRAHGWGKSAYVDAFGLERGNPLSGPATRRRRSAALTARQAVEPAIQQAQAEAKARCRSGALSAAAISAARGRPQPAERRAKTLATLSAMSAERRSQARRRRAEAQRDRTAADVATRFGFTDWAGYVADRRADGMSLAAISREAGLHKDWAARHLAALAPGLCRDRMPAQGAQLRVQALGFCSAEVYLRTRHHEQHRSVAAIAAEAGVSRWTVLAALRRHGIDPVPHAESRHRADGRLRTAAQERGFDTFAGYVIARRGAGVPWKAIAAECGIAETSVRRNAVASAG